MPNSSSPQTKRRDFLTSGPFWFWAVPILLAFAYLPIFLTTFAMHNDYSLLFKRNNGWMGFVESEHLMVVGRPLGAVLVNIPYHFLHTVEDFLVWREIGFLTMLAFLAVLWSYLERKWSVERPWAAMIVTAVGLLPVSTTYVIWVCNWSLGFLTLLFVSGAYFLWEQARGKGLRKDVRVICAMTAFLLFVATLYTYPPTALAVFVFTFGYLLWSKEELRERWKIFWADTLFFGIGMLVYRLTERLLVTPWFMARITYRPWQEEYLMQITHDVLSKGSLLNEILGTTLSGTWSFYLGNWGALVFAVILAAGLGMQLKNIFMGKKEQIRPRLKFGAQVFLSLAGIFILVNAPILLAGGYKTLLGYRVLFCGPVMAVFLLMWSLRTLWRNAAQEFRSFWLALAGGLVLVWALMVLANFKDVTTNYRRELNFIRSQLSEINPRFTRFFFFVKLPEGQTYVQRKMPYEYSLVINCMQHFAPLVYEKFQSWGIDVRGVESYVIDPQMKSTLPRDERVKIIDPMEYLSAMGIRK